MISLKPTKKVQEIKNELKVYKTHCNQYSICKNSSTDYCYKCKENKKLNNYFEVVKENDFSIYTQKKDIINKINKIYISTKIEIQEENLLLIGFLSSIFEEYIIITVNNIDRYKIKKNDIKQLKVFNK